MKIIFILSIFICNACIGQTKGVFLSDSLLRVMKDSGWSTVISGTVFVLGDSLTTWEKGFPIYHRRKVDSVTNIPPNIPPIALAGTDQIIPPKTKTVKLKGIGIDEDGTIVAYYWKQIYGDKVIIKNPTSHETTVTGITGWGIYIFQLTVTDNNGDTGKDNVMIRVQYF